MKTLTIGLIVALITGCATAPSGLSTTYVSPLQYKTYNCDQLIEEMYHVSRRAATLHVSLRSIASGDAGQLIIGMTIFWPALFLLEGGDGTEAVEYSKLKGELEALRSRAVHKECSTESMPLSPEELSNLKLE